MSVCSEAEWRVSVLPLKLVDLVRIAGEDRFLHIMKNIQSNCCLSYVYCDILSDNVSPNLTPH